MPGRAIRPVHLHDSQAVAAQIAVQPGAVAAGALDAEPRGRTQLAHPADQLAVAAGRGRDLQLTEAAAQCIERDRDMHILMGSTPTMTRGGSAGRLVMTFSSSSGGRGSSPVGPGGQDCDEAGLGHAPMRSRPGPAGDFITAAGRADRSRQRLRAAGRGKGQTRPAAAHPYSQSRQQQGSCTSSSNASEADCGGATRTPADPARPAAGPAPQSARGAPGAAGARDRGHSPGRPRPTEPARSRSRRSTSRCAQAKPTRGPGPVALAEDPTRHAALGVEGLSRVTTPDHPLEAGAPDSAVTVNSPCSRSTTPAPAHGQPLTPRWKLERR